MTRAFTCHCGKTGGERTPNKSQHTNFTLEKGNNQIVLNRQGTQQQRPEIAYSNCTWHASKYKVPKFHQRYILKFWFECSVFCFGGLWSCFLGRRQAQTTQSRGSCEKKGSVFSGCMSGTREFEKESISRGAESFRRRAQLLALREVCEDFFSCVPISPSKTSGLFRGQIL